MVLYFTFKQGEKYRPCLFNVLMLSEKSSDGQIAKYNFQKLKGIDDFNKRFVTSILYPQS